MNECDDATRDAVERSMRLAPSPARVLALALARASLPTTTTRGGAVRRGAVCGRSVRPVVRRRLANFQTTPRQTKARERWAVTATRPNASVTAR